MIIVFTLWLCTAFAIGFLKYRFSVSQDVNIIYVFWIASHILIAIIGFCFLQLF